jgi:hypothetical protein
MNKSLRTLLPATLFFFMLFALHAQHQKFKIPDVTMEDLTLPSCSIDSSAPAFVFFDKCDIEFVQGEGNFDVLYTRTLRMKILRKAGIQYGELAIPIHLSRDGSKRDDLRELRAFTYNQVNGKVMKAKVEAENIFEQKISDHLLIRKFAFPDVHEGSVLEIRYEIRSPFRFNLNDWAFQWKIPVLHSECNLKYTPFYLYTYLLKNATKFDKYEEYQVDGLEKEFYNTTYKEGMCHFAMNNVPAFTETDFVSSDEEYLITLHFQVNKVTDTRGVSENLCSTWDELAETLTDDESFGKYISSGQSISKQLFGEGKTEALPPAARFDTIVSWVKVNNSWDGKERIFAEHKAKELLKRKTGSSAEINLFLCGLLKADGIEAYPVLLSSRGNAKVVKDYPFLGFFNYVIVAAKIDDKWILTDGTEPFCANNSFPSRCINGSGLMVQGKKTMWVDIPARSNSSLEDRIRLNFTPGHDSLEAHVTRLAKGYNGIALRNRIGTNTDEAFKYLREQGIEDGDSVLIINAAADSISKPYIIKLSSKIPVTMLDEMPEIDPFCGLAIEKSPFEKPIRKVPVDVNYPRTITMITELVLPAGYRVKQMPESANREDELMSFNYTATQNDGKVMVHAGYTVKKAVYPAVEYKKLQQLYTLIVKKLHEKVYLEKIS